MSSKQRRNDVTTEIVVGAFMFIVLIAVGTFSFVISQNKIFEKYYTLTVSFPDIGGLKEGEGVFMRGVKVGLVRAIEVPETRKGVDVLLRLTREVELHEDYFFKIESASMLGGLRLVIYEGSDAFPLLTEEQRKQLKGKPVANIMEEATETIRVIRETLVDGGVLDNIKNISANLSETTYQINHGTGTISRLIHEDGLYREAETFIAQLNQASTNLTAIMADVRLLTDRIAQGKGTLGRLLSEDETLYVDLTNTMHNVSLATADARKIFDRVEKGEGTIGKLLSGDDAVYKDLAATVASLREFSGNLENQNGTIGRLIKEDGLYVKIESLIDEARATIDDFRETSPITTFSSIFFGAF